MAEYTSEINKLPPGWECRFDRLTGRYYFINHYTKVTTWEDPRGKNRSSVAVSSESIPLQPMHGSPYHVYPASSHPAAQAAFQGPSSGVPSVSASPLLAAKLHQMELNSITKPSPHTPRSMSQLAKQTTQETTFSTAADVEASVIKINSMFPTVSDIHIRLLLKKYYNREAVVISALQVEKHPLTTPGPVATPPPPIRHLQNTPIGIRSTYQMTPPLGRDDYSSRTGSPIPRPGSCASGSYGSPRVGEGFRNSPRPHSSPKMKLRYLKSVFPKADETLLLDVLANAENNVQKASEQLLSMGYTKRDTTAPRLNLRKQEEDEEKKRKELQQRQLQESLKVKTVEEKNQLKASLQVKYKDIQERIISMALESVDYSEDKACQILNIVKQEDDTKAAKDNATVVDAGTNEIQSTHHSRTGSSSTARRQQMTTNKDIVDKSAPEYQSTSTTNITTARQEQLTPIKQQPQKYAHDSSPDSVTKPRQSRPKAKSDHSKVSPEDDHGGHKNNEFKSLLKKTSSCGANPRLYKGPNDELLLADYVTWSGANPDLATGRKILAVGSDPNLRSTERNFTTRGSNHELCKGSTGGLAKGSIYSQLNRVVPNVKCN